MNNANIFYTILIILITSCKEQQGETFTVDGEILEFTEFAEGSYWVYQNISNFELDTVTLIKKSFKNIPGFDDDPNEYINLVNKFSHSHIDYEFVQDYAELSGPSLSIAGVDHVNLLISPYSFGVGGESIFVENIDSGRIERHLNVKYENHGQEEVLIGDTILFTLKVSISSVSSAFSYTSINWAKNIGKVKYTLANRSEWELVKFVPAR